jgi:hypothetical protein
VTTHLFRNTLKLGVKIHTRFAPEMRPRSSDLDLRVAVTATAIVSWISAEPLRTGDQSGGKKEGAGLCETSGGLETSEDTDSSEADEEAGEGGADARASGSVISPPHAPPQRSAYM